MAQPLPTALRGPALRFPELRSAALGAPDHQPPPPWRFSSDSHTRPWQSLPDPLTSSLSLSCLSAPGLSLPWHGPYCMPAATSSITLQAHLGHLLLRRTCPVTLWTYTQKQRHTHRYTHTYTQPCTYATDTCSQIHVHTYTQTHTDIHKHTHTDTQNICNRQDTDIHRPSESESGVGPG